MGSVFLDQKGGVNMELNYFDFIGFGEESCLAPLIGIILFPVLYPLYLVIKVIFVVLEFLMDVFDGIIEDIRAKRESKKNRKGQVKEQELVQDQELVQKESRKEQIARTIRLLKKEKREIEEKIAIQEQDYAQLENTETETNEEEKPMSLLLK